MLNLIKRLVREEDGQGLVEYGLIIAGIALAVIVILPLIGTALETMFTTIEGAL